MTLRSLALTRWTRTDPGEAAPAASALRDQASRKHFDGFARPISNGARTTSPSCACTPWGRPPMPLRSSGRPRCTTASPRQRHATRAHGSSICATPPAPTLRGPIAVLTRPNTRNAGEDVTVALHGRARTRFVGADSAGFPILGARVHRLSGGTSLGVLETPDADRTGLVQRLPAEPDAPLPPAAALDATPQAPIDWLLEEQSDRAQSR